MTTTKRKERSRKEKQQLEINPSMLVILTEMKLTKKHNNNILLTNSITYGYNMKENM